jgi:hypothetical protein
VEILVTFSKNMAYYSLGIFVSWKVPRQCFGKYLGVRTQGAKLVIHIIISILIPFRQMNMVPAVSY